MIHATYFKFILTNLLYEHKSFKKLTMTTILEKYRKHFYFKIPVMNIFIFQEWFHYFALYSYTTHLIIQLIHSICGYFHVWRVISLFYDLLNFSNYQYNLSINYINRCIDFFNFWIFHYFKTIKIYAIKFKAKAKIKTHSKTFRHWKCILNYW